MELHAKEQLEIDAWRDSPTEAPGVETIKNLVNKLTDAPVVFLEAFERHRSRFESANHILELGAGQGWASCLVKKRLGPGKQVIASDLSPFAIESLGMWERVFDVRLDASFHCRSYEIPVEAGSVDLGVHVPGGASLRGAPPNTERVVPSARAGGVRFICTSLPAAGGSTHSRTGA